MLAGLPEDILHVRGVVNEKADADFAAGFLHNFLGGVNCLSVNIDKYPILIMEMHQGFRIVFLLRIRTPGTTFGFVLSQIK